MSFYVSTATFFLLHCDEWDHVVALPRHKFVTGATLLQLVSLYLYQITLKKNPADSTIAKHKQNHRTEPQNFSYIYFSKKIKLIF